MKKYACFGGVVFSDDGSRHYIPARKLPFLFGVPAEECVIVEGKASESVPDGLIRLSPRADGKYETPR